ncbi:MAG: hydroxyacid dehydrogenase [Gammaproteobacteria bacterium]
MASDRKRIVYFKRWMDPVADRILGAHGDIEVTRLDLDGAGNWPALERAHGYQSLPKTENTQQWFATRALLERCPDLLAVCSAGAGYDTIDVDACTEAGVIVCNQAGTNKEAVAEHALGFMLALSKKIAVADRKIRRGDVGDRWGLMNNDIRGKTLGIVGIGHIGSQLAKICRDAFAMPVLAYDPYLSDAQITARGASKVGLDELLQRSDFVSLNCPLTDETRGMIGAAQFSAMKPGAFFITTARGGIHDEAALAAALGSGHLGGAGVDVFDVEPPPADHPLLAFDNVIATPHVGGITHEATYDTASAGAEQWLAIFRGEVPPRLVNPDAWPRYQERFERTFGRRPAALG